MKVLATCTIAIAAVLAIASSGAAKGATFQGAWEHCEMSRGTQYCSSYVLLQVGSNVCGTWEYTATNSIYAGQLEGTALSELVMRKDRVCGSPGSETQVPCSDEDGPQVSWELARGALYLIGGGLDESAQATKPYYARRPFRPGEQADLEAQEWVASCLAR